MTSPFPDDFVWGAATAAHQVEGNNTHSDFWLLEHTPGTAFAEDQRDPAQAIELGASLNF